MTPRRKTLLVNLVGLLWADGLLAAYWWFEIRYIRPFSEQTTLFSGDSLRLPTGLVGPGSTRPVHFWDPTCPCNAGNQQHLGGLIERFAGKGVELHVLQKPGSQGRLLDNLAALRPLTGLPGSEQLPANPVVVIWDRDGCLIYFSPYSEDAVCTSSNSFIEPILEALLQRHPVDATHTLAVGCYCPWPPEKG